MASTQPAAQIPTFSVKNSKKSAVKHSIEKPILLNFVYLSTIFYPRLSEEIEFHFKLGPDPLILHFLKNLEFQKTHLPFKVIFRATQLQQRPKCGIFQKALLFTLVSITNSGLNAVPIAAG